jgi:hypothetical protein
LARRSLSAAATASFSFSWGRAPGLPFPLGGVLGVELGPPFPLRVFGLRLPGRLRLLPRCLRPHQTDGRTDDAGHQGQQH